MFVCLKNITQQNTGIRAPASLIIEDDCIRSPATLQDFNETQEPVPTAKSQFYKTKTHPQHQQLAQKEQQSPQTNTGTQNTPKKRLSHVAHYHTAIQQKNALNPWNLIPQVLHHLEQPKAKKHGFFSWLFK